MAHPEGLVSHSRRYQINFVELGGVEFSAWPGSARG